MNDLHKKFFAVVFKSSVGWVRIENSLNYRTIDSAIEKAKELGEKNPNTEYGVAEVEVRVIIALPAKANEPEPEPDHFNEDALREQYEHDLAADRDAGIPEWAR